MGIYHIGYSAVSKKASKDYLDRVFVDMMWFKAFSVYLILRLKVNVLFQDADLVWFQDPFPYFHSYGKDSSGNVEVGMEGSENIKAFFSDDGQRSLRYSPFYANSGFYYLKGKMNITCYLVSSYLLLLHCIVPNAPLIYFDKSLNFFNLVLHLH